MSHRLLVVDDDVAIADILATLLEYEGHMVFRAHDGLRALAIAARERPHLTLSDVMMPRMGGLERVARLRASGGEDGPPVILLSAVAWLPPQPPRTTFIAKPFDLDDVLRAVAALLGPA